MKKLKFTDISVQPNALLCPNPQEWTSKAYLTENVADNFRLVAGIKSRTKLANLTMTNISKDSSCNFDASPSNLNAIDLDVASIAIMPQICQFTLETSFLAQSMAKGSNPFPSLPDFTAYFFDTTANQAIEERELRRWQGDTSSTNANLALVDGHLKKLDADTTVIRPTFSVITEVNVITALKTCLNALPKSVKMKKQDLRFHVSPDVLINYELASSTGNNTTYVTTPLAPTFLGIKLVAHQGLPDNTIIGCLKDDLLYVFDGEEDLTGLSLIDMKATTGDALLRMRADLKEGFFHTNGNQIVLWSNI